MLPRLTTQSKLPAETFAIAIIGTGGIVNASPLPAYRLAGFPVRGVMNRTVSRAEELARGISLCVLAGVLSAVYVRFRTGRRSTNRQRRSRARRRAVRG
jgi:shikimate 5-dehydrogenase